MSRSEEELLRQAAAGAARPSPGRTAGARREPGRGAPPARARAGRGAPRARRERRRGRRRRQQRQGCRRRQVRRPRRSTTCPAKELKSLADELKREIGSGVVAARRARRRQGLDRGRRDRRSRPRASTRSIWCGSAPRRWAARAAAAVPTWRRPAAPTPPRPRPRSPRWKAPPSRWRGRSPAAQRSRSALGYAGSHSTSPPTGRSERRACQRRFVGTIAQRGEHRPGIGERVAGAHQMRARRARAGAPA